MNGLKDGCLDISRELDVAIIYVKLCVVNDLWWCIDIRQETGLFK